MDIHDLIALLVAIGGVLGAVAAIMAARAKKKADYVHRLLIEWGQGPDHVDPVEPSKETE